MLREKRFETIDDIPKYPYSNNIPLLMESILRSNDLYFYSTIISIVLKRE